MVDLLPSFDKHLSQFVCQKEKGMIFLRSVIQSLLFCGHTRNNEPISHCCEKKMCPFYLTSRKKRMELEKRERDVQKSQHLFYFCCSTLSRQNSEKKLPDLIQSKPLIIATVFQRKLQKTNLLFLNNITAKKFLYRKCHTTPCQIRNLLAKACRVLMHKLSAYKKGGR